ncbi:MAG: hypothetical protein KGJ57_04775 [Sphingomonadales bacterium]|nr:hypothetical protein [Sphingomonadales bacterium]MDE2168729.1 hypothetical protein [Sphingomonadales bacterium]
MDSDVIEKLRREEADLTQKLEAVRMILRAYGDTKDITHTVSHVHRAVLPKPNNGEQDGNGKSREKMTLDRFSAYGRAVVGAAIRECANYQEGPITSREMVRLVEKQGIDVRGADKVNAISALLARSIDLKPNGRKGWTLSDEYREIEEYREMQDENTSHASHNENDPPDDFEVMLGGPDAGTGDAPTSPFHGFKL